MTEETRETQEEEEQTFGDLLEAFSPELSINLQVGDRVRGPVIAIGKESVFVDTGTKLDGIVSRAELLDPEGNLPCQVGDTLELYVVERSGNEIRLSRALSGAGGLQALQEAFRNRVPVEGKVKSEIKGGFEVNLMGRRTFCPFSQMDLRPVADAKVHVGQTYRFLITQLERQGRNIVASRRVLLEKELEKAVQAFMEDVKKGSRVEGRVSRLAPYGAFVELIPGLEGLLHISELSWSRVEQASEAVQVGQDVTVLVLDIQPGEKSRGWKISLSLKQLSPDPWTGVSGQFAEGDLISGRVTSLTRFGAFMEIAPGIEGLVHISEMSYRRRVAKPEEVVSRGDTVQVVVKEIDAANRRISLSIKDAEGDPWQDVTSKYRAGQRVKGVLEKKETFGCFVQLEPGITGLVPMSRIQSAADRQALEKLNPGDPFPVLIEEIHAADRKAHPGSGSARERRGVAALRPWNRRTGNPGNLRRETQAGPP